MLHRLTFSLVSTFILMATRAFAMEEPSPPLYTLHKNCLAFVVQKLPDEDRLRLARTSRTLKEAVYVQYTNDKAAFHHQPWQDLELPDHHLVIFNRLIGRFLYLAVAAHGGLYPGYESALDPESQKAVKVRAFEDLIKLKRKIEGLVGIRNSRIWKFMNTFTNWEYIIQISEVVMDSFKKVATSELSSPVRANEEAFALFMDIFRRTQNPFVYHCDRRVVSLHPSFFRDTLLGLFRTEHPANTSDTPLLWGSYMLSCDGFHPHPHYVNFERALSCLSSLRVPLEKMERPGIAYKSWGQFCIDAGHLDHAVLAFIKAIPLSQDPGQVRGLYDRLIEIYEAMGNKAEALSVAEDRVVKMGTQVARSDYWALVFMYKSAKNYEKEAEAWLEIVKLTPERGMEWECLLNAYTQVLPPREAANALKAAILSLGEKVCPRAYYLLCGAYRKANMREDALEALRTCIQIVGDKVDEVDLMKLAQNLLQLGQAEEAYEAATKVMRDPEALRQATLRLWYCLFLWSTHRDEEAVKILAPIKAKFQREIHINDFYRLLKGIRTSKDSWELGTSLDILRRHFPNDALSDDMKKLIGEANEGG